MSQQQVLLNFAQQHLELFHSACPFRPIFGGNKLHIEKLENHHEEPTPREEKWELFDDGFLREEETQHLCIDEESQEDVYEPRPPEISIVKPPMIKSDYVYKDPMWLAPPPPSLTPFI
ncbi:hypothetical protein TIFTF001_015303 [Ficus carica]|uniref:Uncharacterized protein n=1 Tax=Ficus carica TaxID=3494 RepID=A0AA88D7R8_FICCA|nr:hypothetical protein TIFTF001_015303 [Ficus carica]